MKKKLFIILFVIVMIVAGAMLLTKRRHENAAIPVAQPMIHSVRTTLPVERTLMQTHSYLAELKAAETTAISSKYSAWIRQLPIHESQRIKVGDLLVKLDEEEIVANLKSVQAQLNAALKKYEYDQGLYERNLSLYDIGGLSQQELEASDVTRSTAQAAVNDLQQKIIGLKSQLKYMNIKAPFDAIVGTILLHPGDLASPGRSILTLNSLSQKLIVSFVPESAELQTGQMVLYQGERVGRISRIYNDAQNGLAVAEIVPDKQLNLPSGSYLTVSIVTKTATGCSIPLQSLLHRDQGSSIMTYQEDHFSEIAVSVQVKDDSFAIISPCVNHPVALATEAKLSLLPVYGEVRISSGSTDEK
ncbi:RND family efflux transporter, MFP subunit [Desulfuromusa kysingii]|uniref:RND family efflux transporter, MFP subunit n=1 Tax=Desulfuromusa kysingii TaxID=37625 RepID=A0A1H4DRJ4_9BACT|nr:efflux RND transporter periplasmic adaptor subunit [Desulfuromusa kysingii]SEA75196.1 RND family efflux transporter, MFP subunit [Desulfuromusa kysingii]